MALSPRRCIPLRTLCRGWPPVGASHVLARSSSFTDIRLPPTSVPTSFRCTTAQGQREFRLLVTAGAHSQYRPPKTSIAGDSDLHESPYTVPNALTLGRIIACPFLGYHIVQGNLEWATGILFFGGISDWVRFLVASQTDIRSSTDGLPGGGM
jgi:hypothetical protein